MENDRITRLENENVISRLRTIRNDPSIPKLRRAAVILTGIILKIKDVKDTKTRFQELGRSAVIVFDAAYELYSRPDDREDYLMETLEELIETLEAILHFIEGYIQMSLFFRIISFVPKRRNFKRFRKMLANVAGRLNFSSLQLPLPERSEARRAPTDERNIPIPTVYINNSIPTMVP